jgi:hypothetical protein
MDPADSDSLSRVESYSGAGSFPFPFAYRAFTCYGPPFQNGSAGYLGSKCRSYNPVQTYLDGLGYSAFARRY